MPPIQDRVVAVIGALTIHAAVLFAGGLGQPAEYGVEPGSGGMEVLLVAALPHAAQQRDPQPEERRPDPAAVSAAEEAFVLPEPVPAELLDQAEAAMPEAVHPTPAVGDGSSAAPGTDPITFYSEGGGQMAGAPGHLRNPAPPYPLTARRLGQEGVVMLTVRIDADGRPLEVEVEQSSGFPLLDDSALTTVRRWRFRSARMGGVPVASTVEVPIRFVLRDQ